ncbi:hypothetical protein N656DRAFT_797291 [Canariomyces notabilis]|uniref:DUF7357 domain-containing protein n=1 Tax=Canariomyces notabilis TaxID=2074819 RepID=A0AAN6TFB4_9PEZI|nr:hypothetical protein N656DRAFT_797291 [Canariomyces arenarius]
MRNDILRLWLVVQRHAIPEVRVVFAVKLNNEPTIAHLLEQVNEIIPLESGDWGLEDYAVELRDIDGRGFECLHFQQVSAVLKNDEEVFIRSLVTDDRRKRRLSGRHQISRDGKHLIDGVAFGRPRLKAPRDRPPVNIPPLKRRRIAYETEESDDEEPQFLLTEAGEQGQDDGRAPSRTRFTSRTRFSNADDGGFEGDEEDEDDEFLDENSENSDGDADLDGDEIDPSEVDEELRDLLSDNQQYRDAHSKEHTDEQSPMPSKETTSLPNQIRTSKATALRAAFPTAPVDTCETAIIACNYSLEEAYEWMQRYYKYSPATTLGTVLTSANAPPPGEKTVTEQDDGESDSGAETDGSVVKHYDQHGFPSGSILDGTASKQVAEALRKSGHPVKPPVHTKFDETPESNPNEGGGELHNTTHSSSRSSSAARLPAKANEDKSDDDGDSGPEVISSKKPTISAGAKPASSDRSSVASDAESDSESDGSSESDSEDGSESGDSIDGSDSSDGSDESDGSDLSDSSDDTDGSDGSGSSDGSDDSGDTDGTDSSDGSDSSGSGTSAKAGDSPGKKGSSQGNRGNSSHPSAGKAATSGASSLSANKAASLRERSAPQPSIEPESRQPVPTPSETPKPVPPRQGKLSTQKRNARRRAVLRAQKAALRGESLPQSADVPSGLSQGQAQDLRDSIAAKKASLLQSLDACVTEGLLPPQFEEQANGESDAGPIPPNLSVTDGQVPDAQQAPQKNREAWRDSVVYRAVECCHDGVELSEPPFPFVQRWDPQQQYYHKGGRPKRKQRHQAGFSDEEGTQDAKRRKQSDTRDPNGRQDHDLGYDDTVLNYDEEEQESLRHAKQEALQTADEDDLPPLPADISALPALEPGKVEPGMVLTWKQWVLSKATNWQPQVSNLTGIVAAVPDDGSLTVRLAKRDWNLDHNEKVYDEDGNRIYDKFELPGMDEEEEEVEEGFRTLEIKDMIEPRILAPISQIPAPMPSVEQPAGSPGKDSTPDAVKNTQHTSDSGSRTLSNEVPVGREAVSQEIDTELPATTSQGIISEASQEVSPQLPDP